MLFALGLASCALLLNACATGGYGGYKKPGATEADFNRDQQACQQDAVRQYPPEMAPGFPGGFDNDINMAKQHGVIYSCLKAKGWTGGPLLRFDAL